MIAGKVKVGEAFFSWLVGFDDCSESEFTVCGVELSEDSGGEKDEKGDEMHCCRVGVVPK